MKRSRPVVAAMKPKRTEAMQWALDEYGPEMVYADGERSETAARKWAAQKYAAWLQALDAATARRR
jgi:hypothetical protein